MPETETRPAPMDLGKEPEDIQTVNNQAEQTKLTVKKAVQAILPECSDIQLETGKIIIDMQGDIVGGDGAIIRERAGIMKALSEEGFSDYHVLVMRPDRNISLGKIS